MQTIPSYDMYSHKKNKRQKGTHMKHEACFLGALDLVLHWSAPSHSTWQCPYFGWRKEGLMNVDARKCMTVPMH